MGRNRRRDRLGGGGDRIRHELRITRMSSPLLLVSEREDLRQIMLGTGVERGVVVKTGELIAKLYDVRIRSSSRAPYSVEPIF